MISSDNRKAAIVTPIRPIKALRPFINRIFIFKSISAINKSENEIIPPSGQMKLLLSYKKSQRSVIKGVAKDFKESSLAIVGQTTDEASIECEANYSNICLEFKPFGAYKFFDFPLFEITNQVYDAPDLFKKNGHMLQEKQGSIEDAYEKALFIQEFLHRQLVLLDKTETVLEFAIKEIIQKKGRITIEKLSDTIGYTRRHVLNKFKEHIGLSPKKFARIIRFQEILKMFHSGDNELDHYYDYYYDQSHYIKEFVQFTGKTPREYLAHGNRLKCLL